MTFISWEKRMSRHQEFSLKELNHILTGGHRDEAIFLDNKDRLKFLEYLEEGADRYGVAVFVRC